MIHAAPPSPVDLWSANPRFDRRLQGAGGVPRLGWLVCLVFHYYYFLIAKGGSSGLRLGWPSAALVFDYDCFYLNAKGGGWPVLAVLSIMH